MDKLIEEFNDFWTDFKKDIKEIFDDIEKIIEREFCLGGSSNNIVPPWDYNRTTNEVVREEYVYDISDFQDFDTPLDRMA